MTRPVFRPSATWREAHRSLSGQQWERREGDLILAAYTATGHWSCSVSTEDARRVAVCTDFETREQAQAEADRIAASWK